MLEYGLKGEKKMNYILIAIILIGIIYNIIQFVKGKKEQSFIGMMFATGLTILNQASGDWQDTMVKIIAIICKRTDINQFTGEFNIYYFFFGAILMIIAIIFKFNSKRKVCVLNINGYMKQRIEPYLKNRKDIINDFRERDLNFVNIYKKIFCNRLDEESYECILEQIEEQVNAFKNETIELKRGYTGIAPIPFIMYAGTFFDREKIDEYYEFDKIDAKDYYKLDNSKTKKYPKLKLKNKLEELDVNKGNLVLAISITKKISDSQLKQFDNECNIVKFEVDKPYDNTIKYKKQLNEYVNTIFDTIEEISQKLDHIKTINIVCSSQSCLALEIGRRSVDSTRIPQIVSYQFENQSDIKYPWGVVINGKNKGKLIKVEDVKKINV